MEEFRDYEFKGLTYQVGNMGTIISPRDRVLKKRLNRDGYEEVTLGAFNQGRTSVRVHRLVASVFIPNPDPIHNTDVNHKDFNRQNNDYRNLGWMSHRDNVAYSRLNGRHDGAHGGTQNGRARLDENEVKEIRKKLRAGVRCSDIARLYDIGWSTVYNIKINNTWKGVN